KPILVSINKTATVNCVLWKDEVELTNIIDGTRNEIMKKLDEAKLCEHNLIIYDDLPAFAEIYTQYAKEHLKGGDELIVILTCYETPEKVRRNLSSAGILCEDR